jgi:hypothetical protein
MERTRKPREDVFFVTHDDAAGIDTLVSRLLEEPPVLVILEATGGFERAVVVGAFFGRRGLAGSGGQPSPGA